METRNLADVAIVIRPEKDNIAVLTADLLDQGVPLRHEETTMVMSGKVLRGQSFAICPIKKGEPYMSLGDPIGLASKDVEPGEPIDEGNMEDRLPRLHVRYRDNPAPNQLDPALSSVHFDGFPRPDGTIGTRNYVGIVTSGMCSSTEAQTIASRAMHEIYSREKFPNVDGVVPISQESGCGMPDGRAVDLLNL
ncbi:MAG: UxaA family hydrolase, partial [Terriglobia bacterium]